MSAITPTKLNKLVFYVDFLHFKRNSVSLTGAAYRRLQFGPVPADYRGIQKYLEDRGVVQVVERVFKNGNTGEAYHLGPKVQELELDFSDEEQSVLRLVCQAFDKLIPNQIADRSHQEQAWRETPENEIISYSLACTLSLG